MKKRRSSREENSEVCCALCRLSDNAPDKYGEKITLKEHKLTVHYFCLLTSSGVYQRGKEDEGIYGFLVDDIKQEVRRASRLRCAGCKKKGASVGCHVKSCRKMVHFPCGQEQQFIFQFTDLFSSYCKNHSPTQSVSSCASGPLSCSVCLDPVEPALSYYVLRCPACHTSWFHRDCVQHQAHSAGKFFFRCTLCSNKDQFQQEMLRMGINIPERDASWELEENAFGELLQVYQHCDAHKCLSHRGRAYTSSAGWFEIVRCKLCGSSGTHRKCSSLKLSESNWVCVDCTAAVDGKAALPRHNSPQSAEQGRSRTAKRRLSCLQSNILLKRPSLSGGSSMGLLQALASQIPPVQKQAPLLVVSGSVVLEAGLELVNRSDFDSSQALSVRFSSVKQQSPGNRSTGGDTRHFLRLLTQQLQSSVLFQGPDGAKNLVLNSQALREDLYFDVGCLLSLSLVHGGPPPAFFSRALYQCLFNYPRDTPLTVNHMGDTRFKDKVKMIQESQSVEALREAMQSASEYLEVAGCMRHVHSLSDKDKLVEDIVSFHLITRMQLPFQRFCEGLKTLGVFDQVQKFPGLFLSLFCGPVDKLNAEAMADLFTVQFSDSQEPSAKESSIVTFWRHYLLECEVGRCATSLEDVLVFATSADVVPAIGFHPRPSLSFFHPQDPAGAFPERQPSNNHLVLPVVPTYDTFKKHMEYAVCLTMMETI